MLDGDQTTDADVAIAMYKLMGSKRIRYGCCHLQLYKLTKIKNESDDVAIAAVDVDQNESDADAAIAVVQADVDQNEDADAAIAANTVSIVPTLRMLL